MIFFRVLALFVLFFTAISVQNMSAHASGIVVVVNDTAVSAVDVEDRLKLMMTSSGMPNKKEFVDRLRPQIIDALIDEAIQIQEAERLGLQVEEEDIDNAFAGLAAQNKLEPEQFKKLLEQSKVSASSLRQQLKAQLAWRQVVQQHVGSKVIVSEFDIDDMESRVKESIGDTEYLVAEIFLPVDGQNSDGKVKALGQNLLKQMRGGKMRFSQAAQQFSKSAGANRGGDMGWIKLKDVDDEIAKIIQTTEKGNVSPPTRTKDGYHIIMVRDTRNITEETIPNREAIRAQIGNQRLESAAKRHLTDLKAAAFIERK